MFHWLFRREKLCPGAGVCGPAISESGGEFPCAECAGEKLDRFLGTARGRRITLVTELDRARQAGMTFGPQDLNYAELLLLRILTEEREAYTEEAMKEAQEQNRQKRK